MPATTRARAPQPDRRDLDRTPRLRSPTTSARPAQTSADSFYVGGILPLTGNLAFLGPPEVAGVGLAVSDINAAGGVNGAKACHDVHDSGDSTDMSISTASAGTMVAAKPSVVIGAASSSVSLNVVDTLTDNKITEVSPANTAVDLSRLLAVLLPHRPAGHGPGQRARHADQPGRLHRRSASWCSTTPTAPVCATSSEETVEAAGGECVYGCKGDGDEFPAGQTTFSAEVQAVTRRPSPTRSSSSPSTRPSRSCPSSPRPGLGHVEDLLRRRQHVRLQRGLRARHARGRPGHHARRRPRPGLQGPAQRLVRGWPRARSCQGLSPTAPSPTTPPSSPRSPR